jgi:hypothetical protein
MVTPLTKSCDTCLKQRASPHEMLTAAIRFLATGMISYDLNFTIAISPPALSKTITETCQEGIFNGKKTRFIKHCFYTLQNKTIQTYMNISPLEC